MAEIPRKSSLQAMQSLLNYGDEENDDIDDELKEDDENAGEHGTGNISGSDDDVLEERKPSESPQSVKRPDDDSRHSTPMKIQRLERKVTKLVSYGGDDDINDDDERESDEEDFLGEHGSTVQLVDYTLNESHMNTSLSRSIINMSADEVQLPPTPPGKCSKHLQEKVNKMYEKMKKGTGVNLNASIQRKKEFRNPSIYDKLIEFCGINEKGTNYPPELYNPLIWGKESNYDSLAKLQKEEMDKREKEKKDRTKVEFVVATKKSSSAADLTKLTSQSSNMKQERKSKWDSSNSLNSGGNKPTTVISAVGTLKKSK